MHRRKKRYGVIKREFAKKNLKKVLASSMAMAVLLSSGGFDNLGFVKEAQAAVNVEQTEAVQAVVEQTTDTQTATLSNAERGVIYANSRTDFRDESIYFLITTRFYDGDTSNNARTSEDDNKAHNPESDPSWRGDFKGLIDKLDYIKALGFTAIWITPVVENDSGYDYHGYHAYDFSAVDKRYESNGVTYQTLIDACHEKGIKVIQDVVFNHTCNWGERNLLKLENDVFTKRNSVVMQGGYYYDKAGNKLQDTNDIYHHNGYCGGGDWDEFAAQYKTIADDCLDLNTENPAVYNYLIDCYKKYIDMGVDGFRVDTVKHISRLTLNSTFVPQLQAEAKKNGNNNFYMFGEVCTKGHDVWYRHCPPISTCFYTWKDDSTWTNQWSNDTKSNEALIEAHHNAYNDESIQPTSNNAFLNGNEYHTPDYSKASGLNSIDFQMHWSFNDAWSAFRTATGEDSYFNDSTWNVVYVDSHDYGPDQSQTLRYNGGTDAWAENLSLMFTFRGIPCIYYGSEIEFQAGKVIDPGPNAPLSETGRAYYGDNIEGNVDTVGFTEFGNLSGKVKQTLNKELSQHIMRLNRLRQAIPALRKGQYSTQNCEGGMAFKRRYADSTTDSFALVTISGDATFTNLPGGTYVDAVTGDTKTVSEGGSLTAKVSGKGNMRVYVLSTNKTPAPGRVIPNGDYLNDGGAAELIGEVPINQVLPTGITLNKTSASILEGNTVSLTATIAPSDATDKTVLWTSNNTGVATVSGGKVTGISKGTATITAKTVNGLTATAKITVSENPNIVNVTGISVSPTSVTMSKGDTKTITATITPSNATDKTVTWSTSDFKVATVSNGTITAVGTGSATITATSSNNLKATVEVTVEGPEITLYDHGVYFEKPSGWNNVYVYLFSNDQTVGAAWPGTKINEVGSGVYGYEYSTTDSNLKVIFNNGNSGSGNQTADLKYVDNGYYDISGYVKTMTEQGTVIVKYVDQNGVQIATSDSKKGDVGSSYTTSAKTIAGYKLDTTPDNASGTYIKGTITVSYVYKEDNVVLKTPTPTLVAGDGKITATWSAVEGATNYRVFTELNGGYTTAGYTTSTSYTISGLTNGTKYGVLVLAYGNGAWSKWSVSDIRYVTPAASSTTPIPTLTAGDGQIKVTWSAVNGASNYRIFTALNGTYTTEGFTTGTKFTISGLKNGTKYGVLVLACVNGTWSRWSVSDIRYVTPVASGENKGLTLTAGAGKITATWGAVSGASNYRVFTCLNGNYTTVGYTTTTSFTITGLKSGTSYGVLVLSYVNGAWSKWSVSDIRYATPVSHDTVPGVTLESANGKITANWTALNGASNYRIFTCSNGVYTTVGFTTGTEFEISGLTNGTSYGILVLACVNGTWSKWSVSDIRYATAK